MLRENGSRKKNGVRRKNGVGKKNGMRRKNGVGARSLHGVHCQSHVWVPCADRPVCPPHRGNRRHERAAS
jgi:hypothetical protein